jgi:type I restriction-modification system DNA methylase subunit
LSRVNTLARCSSAIVEVVRPELGECIYDGACGSAGFLCESFEYLISGNVNLQIGGLKDAIRENGVPGGKP